MDILVYPVLSKNRKTGGQKMKKYLVLVLAGLCAALTLVVRIPIGGTGGYFNVGDIAVVFSGLFLGGWAGALAGGIGSAVADIIAGYYIFAPITLIAKGSFAFTAGTLARKNPLWLGVGGLCMVATYFIAVLFLPGMGWAVAISELLFSLIQAVIGSIGGYLVYKGIKKALPKV